MAQEPVLGRNLDRWNLSEPWCHCLEGIGLRLFPENGESIEEAQKRTLDAVRDSRIVLLLQMRDPESVGLRWVEK
jgi:hypothetical protein